MMIEDGKYIFTTAELKRLLDNVSRAGYKEGLIDAGEQYKMAACGLETEANQAGWEQPDGMDAFSPAS